MCRPTIRYTSGARRPGATTLRSGTRASVLDLDLVPESSSADSFPVGASDGPGGHSAGVGDSDGSATPSSSIISFLTTTDSMDSTAANSALAAAWHGPMILFTAREYPMRIEPSHRASTMPDSPKAASTAAAGSPGTAGSMEPADSMPTSGAGAQTGGGASITPAPRREASLHPIAHSRTRMYRG